MEYFSKRLPHVVTRGDLAIMLAPTYAEAQSVDEAEAQDRLERALANAQVLEDLYFGISEALHDAQGIRTSEDELMDRLSKAVGKRRARVKAAASTPAIAAALVGINLVIGVAPEMMRATLATEKGQALQDEGLRALGAHLLKELLK